jgi:predicted Rossmann fold nucleotide-binding protein DprA/Smf involved in DNA uptake
MQRPVAEVRAALVSLELAGRVRRLDGGRYAAR